MKRLIFAILTITVWAVAFAANDGKTASEGPKITFKETSHDFGTIKEADGPVTYEFKFENTGNRPLVILNATASCGCTTPSFTKEPVKPGESGVIKVTYNPLGRPGEFNKNVKVRTNAINSNSVLKVSGSVVPRR